MDWLKQNWSLVAAAGGLVLVAVGLLDVETTARLGVEWDRQQIGLGAGVLIGAGPPALARTVAALRG